MKKSAKVTLTAVAAMGLAACGRHRPDPCEAATFNEQACQQAVHDGGYYWNGSWFPMIYHYPYPYYYDSYRSHVSSGHAVVAAPAGAYSHPATSAPVSPGVERGGFGATGAGHGAGE
jgi:hypothetical protein